MTGFDEYPVIDSIELVIREQQNGPYSKIPYDYQIRNTSWRVLKLLPGTARLSNKWDGIVMNQ